MCQWYVEALDRKLCVVVSSLSRGAKSILSFCTMTSLHASFLSTKMSSIRYPESLSNTNRGDRWCLKTRAMYRMKNEGNYTFVFSQISKLKNWEKSLVLSIIINKYNTHCTFFHFHLATCPREPPPFPPNCPSPTIEFIRVRRYKKKKNQGDTFDFTRHPT